VTVVGHGLTIYSDVTLNTCVNGASSIDSDLLKADKGQQETSSGLNFPCDLTR
jgi:hypothetical protein